MLENNLIAVLTVTLLITYSYYIGAVSIFKNRYHPSIYSRAIWLLLTINSLVSIIALDVSLFVIIYGLSGLVGNTVILLLSIKKSPRVFGKTELISTILLISSLAIWILADAPLINLIIGQLAHLIGGIPTIARALKSPNTENMQFWLYFCIASFLTLLIIDKGSLSEYLYPLYFVVFDGLIVMLCLRRFLPRNTASLKSETL